MHHDIILKAKRVCVSACVVFWLGGVLLYNGEFAFAYSHTHTHITRRRQFQKWIGFLKSWHSHILPLSVLQSLPLVISICIMSRSLCACEWASVCNVYGRKRKTHAVDTTFAANNLLVVSVLFWTKKNSGCGCCFKRLRFLEVLTR